MRPRGCDARSERWRERAWSRPEREMHPPDGPRNRTAKHGILPAGIPRSPVFAGATEPRRRRVAESGPINRTLPNPLAAAHPRRDQQGRTATAIKTTLSDHEVVRRTGGPTADSAHFGAHAPSGVPASVAEPPCPLGMRSFLSVGMWRYGTTIPSTTSTGFDDLPRGSLRHGLQVISRTTGRRRR